MIIVMMKNYQIQLGLILRITNRNPRKKASRRMLRYILQHSSNLSEAR